MNNMKYAIKEIKVREIPSLGNKKVAEVTLEEVGTNKIISKVQIWQDFPLFDTITFGSVVEGELVEKEKNGYKNITLYAPKLPKVPGPARSFGGITKAMETKAANIEHAQDNKERAIKEAAIFRDSTLLTVAQIGQEGCDPALMKEMWEEWKKWLTNKTNEPF